MVGKGETSLDVSAALPITAQESHSKRAPAHTLQGEGGAATWSHQSTSSVLYASPDSCAVPHVSKGVDVTGQPAEYMAWVQPGPACPHRARSRLIDTNRRFSCRPAHMAWERWRDGG